MQLFIFLLCLSRSLGARILSKDLLAVRSISWEDSSMSKCFNGNVILRIRGTSIGQCALKCGSVPDCKSFNYYFAKICDLNTEDVFSIQQSTLIFVETPGCVYIGMRKQDSPSCKERLSFKSIQNDADPGVCEINRKRVDRQWTEWESEALVSSKTEFKEFGRREIITDYAHGGKRGSDLAEKEEWLKFVATKKSWVDARKHCQDLGGELFSDLNGTAAQIEFIVNQFGFRVMWLGVYRETKESTQWVTTRGEKVPDELIYWEPNSQEPKMGRDKYVKIHAVGKKLKYLRGGSGARRAFLCDMR